jgi:hypothetical protein
VTRGIRHYCLDKPERFGGKVYRFDHQRHVVRRGDVPVLVEAAAD